MSGTDRSSQSLRTTDAFLARSITVSTHTAYALWFVFACLIACKLFHKSWRRYRTHRKVTNVLYNVVDSQTTWSRWCEKRVFGHSRVSTCLHLEMMSIPTGSQFLILSAYVVAHILSCTIGYRVVKHDPLYDNNTHVELCKGVALRTGIIAFANLPLAVGLAGRNNILVLITGVPKQTWMVLHHAAGRMIVILSIVHTICYLILFGYQKSTNSYDQIIYAAYEHQYFKAGIAALVAAMVLFTHSVRFIRVLWYEWFILLHITSVVALMVGGLLHAKYAGNTLKITIWIYIAIALFMLDFVVRLGQIIYFNAPTFSKPWSMSQAILTPLPGDITQVDIKMPQSAGLRSGETVYLTFPKHGILQSHPFTLVSTTSSGSFERARQASETSVVSSSSTCVGSDDEEDEKKVDHTMNLRAIAARSKSHTSSAYSNQRLRFMIKARNGMTKSLLHDAVSENNTLSVIVQPVIQSRWIHPESFNSIIFVAGGIGITAILPELRSACRAHDAPDSITLYWIVRTRDETESLTNEMEKCRQLAPSRCRVTLRYYITGEEPARDSDDCRLRIYERPELDRVLETTLEETIGKTALVACGPGSLLDVTRLVISSGCKTKITYYEQSL